MFAVPRSIAMSWDMKLNKRGNAIYVSVLPGGRPPPISLSAGGGVERQGSNDPPQFMRALADMHCGTSPQQKMMQEQKRQEWLRQLNEQMSEQRARSLY